MKKNKFLLLVIMLMVTLFFCKENVRAQETVNIHTGQLGISYTESGTEFNIWSSSASKIELILEGKTNPIELDKLPTNVWSTYVEGDQINKTYTYTIYYADGEVFENVLDPYGKTLNTSNNKNIISNNSLLNPDGWDDEMYSIEISDYEKIIYGLNARNFTTSSEWRGPASYKGRLLGIIEENIKHTGLSVGFDHIKSLGVNYVEISGIFNSISPFAIDSNVVVGSDSYSGNYEMKQLVSKFHQNGINISIPLDIYGVSDEFLENLNKIDKEYYLTSDHKLNYNQYMVEKYFKDLVSYYIEEYKIEGLKYENMGYVDVDLINDLSSAAKTINNNIFLYGDGAYSTLDANKAGENNFSSLKNISFINKSLSYGLLGNVNAIDNGGVLVQNFSENVIESLKFTLLSGINNGQLDYSLVEGISYKQSWGINSSGQLINIIGDRDGLSIHDKLILNGVNSQIAMQEKLILSYGMMMLSGGVPYIYSGDEFLMSYRKSMATGNYLCDEEDTLCFYTEEKNKIIDWRYAVINEVAVDAVKSLVNFRKNNHSIAPTSETIIKKTVKIYQNDNVPGVIGYIRTYPGAYVNTREKTGVLFNFSQTSYEIKDIKGKGWKGLYNYNDAQRDGEIVNMAANSIHIEYKIKQAKVSSWFTLIFVIAIISGVYGANIFLSKKMVEKGYEEKDIKRKYRPFVKKDLEKQNNKENNEENNIKEDKEKDEEE